jgi:hypothetical protein
MPTPKKRGRPPGTKNKAKVLEPDKETQPPLGKGVKDLPDDDKERSEILKKYRFYAKLPVLGLDKLYAYLDSPMSEDERESAIEIACVACYQEGIHAFHWGVLAASFIAATGGPRVLAWYEKKEQKKGWKDAKVGSVGSALRSLERDEKEVTGERVK